MLGSWGSAGGLRRPAREHGECDSEGQPEAGWEYREERGVAFAISLGWRWLAPQSQSNIAMNNTRHPIAVTLRVQGPGLPVLARPGAPRGRWAVILTRGRPSHGGLFHPDLTLAS